MLSKQSTQHNNPTAFLISNHILSKLVIGFIGYVVIMTICHAQTVTVTGNIPYAADLKNDDGTLKVWTMSKIREDKHETVNPTEGSVMTKDNNSRGEKLGDRSYIPKETKPAYNGTLDLSNAVFPATIAILVDDIAILTVTERLSGNELTGHTRFTGTYKVNGTALWNPKSYKEFPTPLPPGRKYELSLIYTNTANLTANYSDGKVDVDGVSVYVSLLPVEIEPDANMAGVVGDVVKSAKPDSIIKHFVTPKANPPPLGPPAPIDQQYVVLKAIGMTANAITMGHMDQTFEWEGGEAVPGEPLKRRVERYATGNGPTEIKIKTKQGGTVVAEMYVWVVWAEGNKVGDHPISTSAIQIQTGDATIGPGLKISGGYDFKFTIKPQGICTTLERPDLGGANSYNGKIIDPPGSGLLHIVTNADLKGGVDKKWDVSRRLRAKILNPTLYTKLLLDNAAGTFWDNQPVAIDIPASFPNDSRIGNDDSDSLGDEENNPYLPFNFPTVSHAVEEITSTDQPSALMRHSTGTDGDTHEERLHFGEFSRLLIRDKWYVISDNLDWRAHFKLRRLSGLWTDDGSSLALDNLGF